MYLKFYGLRDEPFGVTPDPRFLYLSPTYREAQATLEYGIRSGRGFTALVAKPGMGKTTLLFHLLEQYSTRARTAFIFLTQCDSREFMRYLMSELGANTAETDFVRLQDEFGQLLMREAQAGKKVIAVVDEAQNLDVSVLETVRLLSDFETPRFKLLHIILTGQPELADKLASPELLQLRQRISHLVRLEPLSEAQVRQYIEYRLRVAGYVGPPLFTAEAYALIVQRSEGIPRLINNLCFNALSLGCALGRRTIDAAILAEVSADLDFEAVAREKQNTERPAPPAEEAAAPSYAGSVNGTAGVSEQAATAALERSSEVAASPFQPEPVTIASAPGPVLVPPAQVPAAAVQHEESPAVELGNLALQMEPNGAAAQPALAAEPGPVPANGAIAAAPSNGSTPGPNGAGENGNPIVDVDAIASDCALFGMELSRRWKRPAGAAPAGIPGAAVPRRTAAPKPAAPRPVARPANGASAKIQRMPAAQPARVAPGAGVVKNPATRVSPAVMLRRRRSQRSLYLAAAASVLLLILLGWLLAGSGPSPAPAATGTNATATAADSPAQAAPATSDGAAAAPVSDSSVLDVVEELPQPGEGTSQQDARPAVVVRGTRAGEQLVRRVDPVYPAAARMNRIQGPVVLEASIGTHGFLRHIRVVSGDPLLAEAVLDAVKGWRYQPRTVRGRAVEAPTRIVVNFQLVARNSAPAR